jgi:type IVB pilus formation R64 PilN family outer membrane protein
MVEVKKSVDADVSQSSAKLDEKMASIAGGAQHDKLLYTTILPGAWLGKAKKVKHDGNELPAAFYSTVTLKFPDRANFSTLAERITRVTGIPVKLRPDVFINAAAFAPKNGSSPSPSGTGGTTGAVAANPAFPGETTLTAASVTADYSSEVPLSYHGKLSTFLDRVSARTGLNWEYKDGAIVLSRLVTRTFTLNSIPGSSELNASVGKTGGATASAGTKFSSDSNIKMNSAFSVWSNLRESVNTMLTGVGKVAVTEATGTITVTDTREVVDQVGAMVSQINKSLSRQVAFRVEVLSVSTNNSSQYGIDWTAVFNKVVGMNPNYRLALGSPASLVGGDAGKIAYTVLAPAEGTATINGLSGSTAMLSALASLGKASVVTTASVITLNRQPAPVAITNQISYVQSVSVQPNTNTTGTSNATTVQVNPGTVTTGFILNMLPSITEGNGINVQFSIDISQLSKMGTFGSGQMAVQTPEVSGMQFLQNVAMKNGETLVLSGFERTSGQYDRRTMSEDADLLLGGSINGTRAREAIVILITPVLSEGA